MLLQRGKKVTKRRWLKWTPEENNGSKSMNIEKVILVAQPAQFIEQLQEQRATNSQTEKLSCRDPETMNDDLPLRSNESILQTETGKKDKEITEPVQNDNAFPWGMKIGAKLITQICQETILSPAKLK